MGTTTVVETARRALGPAGVFLPFSRTSAPSADLQREAVRRLERAGYRTAWTNEAVGGKDALVQSLSWSASHRPSNIGICRRPGEVVTTTITSSASVPAMLPPLVDRPSRSAPARRDTTAADA